MHSFLVSFFEGVVLLGLPFFLFPLPLCVFPGRAVNDVRAVGEARLAGGYAFFCYATVEAVLRVFLFIREEATQMWARPILSPIKVSIIDGRIFLTPLVVTVSVGSVIKFLFQWYSGDTRSVWQSLKEVLLLEVTVHVFWSAMGVPIWMYWPIIDPIEVYIIAGRIIFTPLVLIVMIVSVATVVMFSSRLYFDYTCSVWLSLRHVLVGEASRIPPSQERGNKSTIDSILKEKLEDVYLPDRNLPQGHTEESWMSHLRGHGLYFPSWSMGYREKKSTPYIFVIDHTHRNASLFLYLLLGLVSFQFLATPVAVVYTIFMAALFVFQQVGLYKIYNISPYAYFVVDISFQLVGLFLAVIRPEIFLFSCKPVQYLFMVFVSMELYFSWKYFKRIEGS